VSLPAEPSRPEQRPKQMIRRALPFLVAFTCLVAACGSEGDAPGDTLPNPDVPATEVPVTAVPVTDPPVAVTDPLVDDDAQAQLDSAVARWNGQGPTSYTMITQQLCFCPPQEWSDTVVDGEVTEHVALTDDAFFDPGPATMSSLFADVQEVIDAGYAALDLAFDPETGALIRYFVDIDERMADEESGIEVLTLEPLS
jgi:hypothetical protein